jgi:hypothetical protein
MNMPLTIAWFDSNVHFIEIELLKEIRETRKIMIQEFQNSVAFQTIQVMSIQMLMIRFNSMTNLAQNNLISRIDISWSTMIQELQCFGESAVWSNSIDLELSSNNMDSSDS